MPERQNEMPRHPTAAKRKAKWLRTKWTPTAKLEVTRETLKVVPRLEVNDIPDT